ncbi:hypothetical protein C0995_016056 [Termitomyces sp. Mi166|nr:hypothetical protein C0995_016056 [Termitomyces sp. Mi166\
MASNEDRDRLFPATSIGRTAGSRLQPVPSKELLSAHPLLSPSSSSDSGSGQTTPRYVPYTPRQRVSPTAATTGTTAHPPSPHHQQGDATSKLQLVNLKAAAQNIGLDTGSVGWAILEKLVHESDHHDSEWTEIWSAVTAGKSTLLLPLEPSSGYDKLTPEFVKGHVVLCDSPSRKSAPIVTLSGLRGTLNYNKLTFRSTIHPDSKTFHDLLLPSTRASALSALPDLPLISPSSSYPTYTVPAHSSSLPLPPRTPSTKPPLPPRPGNRVASSSSTASTSRISNPFASLFGGGSGSSTSNHPKSSTPAPSSPSGSVRSLDSTHTTDHVIEISAFTIDRKIVRKDIAKEMNKALRREVKALLETGLHMPSWVGDRVHEFTAEWYPFIKEDKNKSLLLGHYVHEKEKENGEYVVAWTEEAPENTSQRVQDFYLALEQELRLSEESFLGRLMKEHAEDTESTEDEKRVKEKVESEAKIKESMDAVERTICTLFYDRLYMQPTSDDLSHDETLSSRVAALNMLDLGLEHLDIHVEHPSKELDLVIKDCGETLSQLQGCRSPGDKAALLVAAHKSVVGGLSRLPPIRLMSEEESKAQKAKNSQLAQVKANAPPREPDGTLRIMVPLGSSSSTATASGTPKPTKNSVVEAPAKNENDLETPHANTSTHQTQASPLPQIVELVSNKYNVDPQSTESSTPSSTSPAEPTPVSGDVLLPMIIFSVVKANPPHLVSSLLYTQRYRNQSIGGEESYCLVNLMAVAEFLENVDLAALGLGDSDKVLSAADLTPIPLNRSPITNAAPLAPAAVDGLPGRLRGGVEQANKVITGVVDTSFGMLRSLLPHATPADVTQQSTTTTTSSSAADNATVPIEAAKPGFGLLRRESGFSIRSITAALDRSRSSGKGGEEAGQQLVEVSKPASVKSTRGGGDESSVEESEEDSDEEDDDEEEEQEDVGGEGDARSIRSFESMLSANSRGRRKGNDKLKTRKSLTDRLAHMSSLAGVKAQNKPTNPIVTETPASSRSQSPEPQARTSLRLAPPIARFVECSAGDLRLSEVGELLRDYRRLVEGIRAVKGFDE